MGTLRGDIPFVLRMSLKIPGWTILALLTFPLGIGGSTPIFSVANDVLPRTLPRAESEEPLLLAASGRHDVTNTFFYPDCDYLYHYVDVFVGLAATMPKRLSGKSILAGQFST